MCACTMNQLSRVNIYSNAQHLENQDSILIPTPNATHFIGLNIRYRKPLRRFWWASNRAPQSAWSPLSIIEEMAIPSFYLKAVLIWKCRHLSHGLTYTSLYRKITWIWKPTILLSSVSNVPCKGTFKADDILFQHGRHCYVTSPICNHDFAHLQKCHPRHPYFI